MRVKRLLACFLLFVISVGLVGCGESNETPNRKTTRKSSGKENVSEEKNSRDNTESSDTSEYNYLIDDNYGDDSDMYSDDIQKVHVQLFSENTFSPDRVLFEFDFPLTVREARDLSRVCDEVFMTFTSETNQQILNGFPELKHETFKYTLTDPSFIYSDAVYDDYEWNYGTPSNLYCNMFECNRLYHSISVNGETLMGRFNPDRTDVFMVSLDELVALYGRYEIMQIGDSKYYAFKITEDVYLIYYSEWGYFKLVFPRYMNGKEDVITYSIPTTTPSPVAPTSIPTPTESPVTPTSVETIPTSTPYVDIDISGLDQSTRNKYLKLNSRKYLIDETTYRFIDEEELAGLSAAECRIARNEIYARYGLIFKSEDLKKYFSKQKWYYPYINSSDAIEPWLNKYEKANIATIKAYEDKGCPYSSYEREEQSRLVHFTEWGPDSEDSIYLEYTSEHSGYASFYRYTLDVYEEIVSESSDRYYFEEDENLNGIFYDLNTNAPVNITYTIEYLPDYQNDYRFVMKLKCKNKVYDLLESEWAYANVG